jgi:hypothetical protein
MVVYSPTEFVKIFASSFVKSFKQGMSDEEIVIDKKWENRGIKKSKVIPPEGIPLKIKYRIANSEDIKGLKDLKMTMGDCPVKN